jgi:hypothetical protein
LKVSFIILKSSFKSGNFIFIPNFQENNTNNHIPQAIICEKSEMIQAQFAHIAGNGQCPATNIGARIKFISNDKIPI